MNLTFLATATRCPTLFYLFMKLFFQKLSHLIFFFYFCSMNIGLKISVPLFFLLILSACSSEERTPVLALNSKIFLKEWPDSAYVQSIDSIIAAEPIKKQANEKKTNIILNASPTNSAVSQTKPSKPIQQEASKPKSKAIQSESFMDRFANSISKWQSDPNNSALYKTISAKENEDVIELLARIYGKEAKKLPRFYTMSVLQSLNPGISMDKPGAGAQVRIPKL